MSQRYFEDFHSGDVLSLGECEITKEEIIAYASVYDAQPFHVDEDAAKKLMLGGLAVLVVLGFPTHVGALERGSVGASLSDAWTLRRSDVYSWENSRDCG